MSKFGINRFANIEDTREARSTERKEKQKDLYDSLINLIVNHKMELQKVPLASSLSTATAWAAKRGMRAGEVDLNRDGHPETVVYNKAGQPVIINGYRLKASDYPVRKLYYDRNPSRIDRIDNPMSSWVKSAAYDVREDPDNPWKRTVTKTAFGAQLKEWGYKMPTKPKKTFSVFSVFSKLIAPIVKTYLESETCANVFSNSGGPECVKVFRKLASPITLYRVLYMKIVERSYFFELRHLDLIHDYKSFKQYIKDHPNKFWTYFATTFLSNDLRRLKDDIITPESVALNFVKDTCEWDGSDSDDVIVFLIGMKNIEDDLCAAVLRNNEQAEAFLELLKGPKSKERTTAAKSLEKWKERARASQKQFFKDMVQYLFENQGAFERYSAARESGVNPFTNASNAEEASATAAPVDVTTVESGTTPQMAAPGEISSPVKVPEENSELKKLYERLAELEKAYDNEADEGVKAQIETEINNTKSDIHEAGGQLPEDEEDENDFFA